MSSGTNQIELARDWTEAAGRQMDTQTAMSSLKRKVKAVKITYTASMEPMLKYTAMLLSIFLSIEKTTLGEKIFRESRS